MTTYVGYQLSHNKYVSPQTYYVSDKDDALYITLDKALFNDRLVVNVVAIAPLKWGDGTSKTYLVSPAMQSVSYFNSSKSNNSGALQLSVTYRFMGGKSVREYNRQMSDER